MREPAESRPIQSEPVRPEPERSEQLSTADLARSTTERETGGTVRNRAIEENGRDEESKIKPMTGGGSSVAGANVRDMSGGESSVAGSNIRQMPQREHSSQPLFNPNDAGNFRSRWDQVQAAFVDDPRHAVEDADHLVADAIKLLATGFADERSQLEQQWQQGNDVSTEDLRVALQRYRSFFERLLAA